MIQKLAVDISFTLNITPKEFPDVVGIETLKLHYDGLNGKEKALFRHIACFLNNETYENVIRLLEDSELDVGVSLKILFDKSLIQISEERLISLHHVLQNFGRDLALGPFINHPANRQFLMDTSESCDVLIDLSGIRNVFGISFKVQMEERLRRDERFKGIKKLRFMRVYKKSFYGKEVRFHLVKGLHSLWDRLNNT
ncbi:unnamed protein product [Thlaspi arvense]|nr:unnamed protein product [Thlaspi arvense]